MPWTMSLQEVDSPCTDPGFRLNTKELVLSTGPKSYSFEPNEAFWRGCFMPPLRAVEACVLTILMMAQETMRETERV